MTYILHAPALGGIEIHDRPDWQDSRRVDVVMGHLVREFDVVGFHRVGNNGDPNSAVTNRLSYGQPTNSRIGLALPSTTAWGRFSMSITMVEAALIPRL